jgi:uncharacterized protein YbbC (DUF1343 family)
VACGGCQIHVLDREVFEPMAVGAALLRECYGSAPDKFQWRDPPYEYEKELMPIDILAGSPTLRQQVEAQMPLASIISSWGDGVREFEAVRKPYLLY